MFLVFTPYFFVNVSDSWVMPQRRHRILVSAEPSRLPEELVEQLAEDGGRMVIPVAGVMRLVVRRGGEREVSNHGHYRFVPLR